MICIRDAEQRDRESIRAVHRHAFPDSENQLVSALAVALLTETTSPETIALVAEVDGEVVGHIALSPVTIANNPKWQGYILAPLGVKPEYQNRRIASQLIEAGLQRLTANDVDVLFVYGDPKFYGKFGFTADAASRYSPPFELQHPIGWQAMVLKDVRSESTATITCVAALQDPRLW